MKDFNKAQQKDNISWNESVFAQSMIKTCSLFLDIKLLENTVIKSKVL